MKTMLNELRKEITLIKTYEMKPNFAYLSRKYGMDYRTVMKYYNGYEGKPSKHNKKSCLDEYEDLIREKMGLPGAKASSLYFFLKETKNYQGSYSNLTHFLRKKGITKNKGDTVPNPRYETSIGEQMQFDFVEDITLISRYGEIFKFNVFSAELSYSRMHYFHYTVHKTQEDVMKCLVHTFKFFGGTPEGVLTDNMSSIVNTKELVFYKEFNAFLKDFDIQGSKCKVRHAYTKGKVEVRNKFMKWLIPFNFEFETEEDLIKIIEKINIEVNNRVNSTTNMKPVSLYQKEKEYLHPLPKDSIMTHYLNLSTTVTVSNTSLFRYKGIEYSVPPEFINKTLKIQERDNKLYVYNNTDLVTIHDISDKNINYKEEHYKQCLSASMPEKSDDFIENLAKKNLDLFDELANQE